VLSHLGFPQDCKLAAVVPGIDVILSGHTHNRLEQPADVNGTLIIQSGAHGSFVGRLDLDVTHAGLVTWRHALLPVDDATDPDAEMAAIVDHAIGAFAGAGAHVVGTTRTALDRYAMFESTMDNLLLDAIADAADRPIALSNGWRYGAPIPSGPLTELDLWNIVPANPPVSVVAISGKELRKLFEENLEATFACDPWQQRGGYLKRCRGIQLAVKLENARGHRIQELRVDGDRLRRETIYSVAFLGEQAVPTDYGRDRQPLGMHAVDALRQYLSRHDSVSADLRGPVVVI
jgi:2',3'-cyclic-nucleotide 2'-phosphodiesterase (5'-nucleotidase family)